MVDLPDASVIVGGLDHWNYDPSHIPTINEERLTAKMASRSRKKHADVRTATAG